MPDWIRLCAAADCPPDSARECVAGGRIVALFNVEGSFHALDGVCPHQGGPLGKGTLEGCVVTCPWHGWQFDVRSGAHQINPSIVHTRFPVQVTDGEVWIDLGNNP
jgi:nitrite reductase/ring-hydroxylating ferredoxin subunit